jgi:predicted nuclease of predicted toxin-antitoxin system
VRLLADIHISPRTVAFLRGLGHDVVRVDDVLPNTASDEQIVVVARSQERAILTQDLDFSAIVALSGARGPSLITLRLSSSRVDHVNAVLVRVLPQIGDDLALGTAVTVEEEAIRRRTLPIAPQP